jgi:hypothetical protein
MISTTVLFCCPRCGAGYQAEQRAQGESKTIPGHFDCQVCGREILAWTDRYEYVNWKAVETVRVPGKDDGPRRPRLRY